MKTGDILKVKIIDDNHLGNGIAKQDNITIFVPKTIKGDVVEIKVIGIQKNIAFSEALNILEKNKEHVEVNCPYYNECGGCNLLHISYDREKELKENYTKKLFKDFNKHIISLNRYNYRNKVIFHVENGQLGFYKEKTNQIINIKNCLLLEEDINKVVDKLNKINLSGIEKITIKKGYADILIDVKGNILESSLKELIKNKQIRSIYQNDELIYGDKYINIRLGDADYSINNNSFFQINTKCAKELYDKIKERVDGCNSLLDLYCGTGSIGLYLCEKADHITGIEINSDSVLCAKENIKNNGANNYEIIHSDASNIDKNYDVVIVDPPRSGLSKRVIALLNNMMAEKIIYVSCNQSTLKRDLDLLVNYCIMDMDIFNMFPGTKHCESLVILERR